MWWLSHFQHSHWLSRPAGSLILASISPHYWQRQQSQLLVAVSHCGLYKTCQFGNSVPLLTEALLNSGRASAASQAAGPLTVSERPRQRPPELETDCLGECSINQIQHTTRRNDNTVAVKKNTWSNCVVFSWMDVWTKQKSMTSLPVKRTGGERFCQWSKKRKIYFIKPVT